MNLSIHDTCFISESIYPCIHLSIYLSFFLSICHVSLYSSNTARESRNASRAIRKSKVVFRPPNNTQLPIEETYAGTTQACTQACTDGNPGAAGAEDAVASCDCGTTNLLFPGFADVVCGLVQVLDLERMWYASVSLRSCWVL